MCCCNRLAALVCIYENLAILEAKSLYPELSANSIADSPKYVYIHI